MFGKGDWKKLLGLGKKPGLVGVRFATDGSGVPATTSFYRGVVTVTQSTNDYLIALPGAIKELHSCVVWHGLDTGVVAATGVTFSDNVVTVSFSATVASTQVNILILASSE